MINFIALSVATLGDAGTRVGVQSTFLQENSELIAAFVGILMVITGILKLKNADTRERDFTGIGLITIGSLMFGVGVIIKLFLLSTVGDSAMADFETNYGIL